jgi:hypothetical protein
MELGLRKPGCSRRYSAARSQPATKSSSEVPSGISNGLIRTTLMFFLSLLLLLGSPGVAYDAPDATALRKTFVDVA